MSDGFFSRMQATFDHTIARRKLEKELDKIIPYANDDSGDDLEVLEG
jgi:hypothetical protein